MKFSERMLKRKIWQDEAINCLRGYRPPRAPIKAHEILKLMALFDAGKSPADAAEIVQAGGGLK